MLKRLPILPTILVALAVATMIALGFWQLGRGARKDALLARYHQAANLPELGAWPQSSQAVDDALYRRAEVVCDEVLDRRSTAGRNALGQSGWAQVARCSLDGGGMADVVLGWARAPQPAAWTGGRVTGVVGPGGKEGARLVADPPLAGLAANARPDPSDVPNNHLAYAVQWFFFAATALLIYFLAVRKRLREAG